MLQFMIRMIPVSLFLLPNSLLNLIGINYMGTGGSALGKLHPSFYLSLAALGFTFLLSRSVAGHFSNAVKGTYRLPMAAAILTTFVTMILSRSGTGDFSAAIVTFLTPAIVAYVFQFASTKSRQFIYNFLVIFFAINSLVGLVELVTSWRLLPYYVSDQIITFDRRPTALLGHPLLNALLTGAFLLAMITRQITLGQKVPQLLQMALHGAAIFAFGGRASLAFLVIISGIYALRHSGLIVRAKVRQSVRSMALVISGILFFVVLTVTGVTETLLDRFVNATDSTNTRFAALSLLEMLSFREWLIGVEGPARTFYLNVLQTPFGIEISVIAMIYVYGLPLAALLIWSTYRLLFQWASNDYPGKRYLVVFFIMSTLTSLSIGSKSLLISQFLIILFCLPAALEEKQKQSAGNLQLTPKSAR